MILADTGYWVALFCRRDKFHSAAVAAERVVGDEQLVTTWPVVTEACFLILRDNDQGRVLDFLDAIRDGVAEMHDLPKDAPARIGALMRKYRSLPMDLADASLIVVAEELDEGRILTIDHAEFSTYRWKKTKSFQNLLLSA